MFNFAVLKVLIIAACFSGITASLIHIGRYNTAKYLLLEEGEVTVPFTSSNKGEPLIVESQYNVRLNDSMFISTILISCDGINNTTVTHWTREPSRISCGDTNSNIISVPEETNDILGKDHADLKITANITSTIKYKVQIYGFQSKFLYIRQCSSFRKHFGREATCHMFTYDVSNSVHKD